jgi:lipopolysaccharide/colanic/teichoic acid biosynthesis glycosyltransferase
MAMEVARGRQHSELLRFEPDLSYRFYQVSKRIMDITVALVALLFALPLMAIIAAAIKLDSPGPVIFRQKRVKGIKRNGRPVTFDFLKFRSMVHNADTAVHKEFMAAFIAGKGSYDTDGRPVYKIRADKRVTRVGAFLRKTSLDELPQLLCVLRGDMSVVGPRPAIPYEVAQYQTWHKRRLAVKPGMTGLWQVKGRSSVAFDDMVKWDIEYAADCSLGLDVSILLHTIPAVFSGRGAA